MYEVRMTAEALAEFQSLPLGIRARLLVIYERLNDWPIVSGVKPLRHTLKGAFRVRTGDYRVLFTVDTGTQRISVFRIAHRRDVYE